MGAPLLNGDAIRRLARALGIDLRKPTEPDQRKLCRMLGLQWDEIEKLLGQGADILGGTGIM